MIYENYIRAGKPRGKREKEDETMVERVKMRETETANIQQCRNAGLVKQFRY